jgi:hypothetical protein
MKRKRRKIKVMASMLLMLLSCSFVSSKKKAKEQTKVSFVVIV